MIEPTSAAAVKQIASVFDKAFDSPAKEIGNYIADKIRYLRYSALLKIVKKAEEKAHNSGMHLKMPALKFFVPFCEAASLEERVEDEEPLSEAWARLLLDASKKIDPRHLLYLRILKEVTLTEILYLKKMVESARVTGKFIPGQWRHYEDSHMFDSDTVFAFLRHLDPEPTDGAGMISQIITGLEGPGSHFRSVSISVGSPYIDMVDVENVYDAESYHQDQPSIDVLTSIGVIREFYYPSVRFERHQSYSVDLQGTVLTQLGINFYEVCCSLEGGGGQVV